MNSEAATYIPKKSVRIVLQNSIVAVVAVRMRITLTVI